jgi:hypothetical protein
LPTLRFEGPNLEEAVEAARGRVGPSAKIVGASRVRRGGLGGFFSREHVEVEVEIQDVRATETGGQVASLGTSSVGTAAPVAGTGAGAAANGDARRRPANGRPKERPAETPPAPRRYLDEDELLLDDPVSELIGEMASRGPTSVLDLAEAMNADESRYSLTDERPRPAARVALAAHAAPAARVSPAAHAAPVARTARSAPERERGPLAGPTTPDGVGTRGTGAEGPADFGAVLARIARQSGLVAEDELGVLAAVTAERSPQAVPAKHAQTILTDLEIIPDDITPKDVEPKDVEPKDVDTVTDGVPVDANLSPSLARHGPSPERPVAPAPAGLRWPEHSQTPVCAPGPGPSDLEKALRSLGLPALACPGLLTAATRSRFEDELRLALEKILPGLPTIPRSASSVVAVVGPHGQVMETAWTLAAEMGTPEDEVALATQRNLWRHEELTIASPEAAAEQRRSWRWRDHPSVVAIESPVRPTGTEWAGAIIRALEPTLCWGVVEAGHKPEDVVAWSRALGGLDVLALVDLDGTTTPAALLATTVPVGRMDGQEATAGEWARVLCSRLMAG